MNRPTLRRRRRLVEPVSWLVGSVAVSGVVSAHGGADAGAGALPVAFPVVLWAPVVAGLLGGMIALHVLHAHQGSSTNVHRADVNAVLGVLVLGLGGAFAITVIADGPAIGAAGLCVGALAGYGFATRVDTHRQDGVRSGDDHDVRHAGHHGDLTLWGISAHRLLEGVAIGTLYTASAAIGTIGVAVLAGHTALETAAVGGLFAARRGRALGAIVLVQVAYLAGALAGLVGGVTVPEPVHLASVGLLAGVLLLVGATAVRNASTVRGFDGVPE